MSDYIDIVFDGPPEAESGRFVEVEDADGVSIRIGDWLPDGNLWRLRIPDPRALAALRERWDKAIEYARSLPSDGHITGWTVLDALAALERREP